jgi:hypothetical protein
MNFHFAHQSSNPTTPGMQSVSPMGRETMRQSQSQHVMPIAKEKMIAA